MLLGLAVELDEAASSHLRTSLLLCDTNKGYIAQ